MSREYKVTAKEYDISCHGLSFQRVLEALERSPYVSWLPSDKEARSAVARDLSMMIADRMPEE